MVASSIGKRSAPAPDCPGVSFSSCCACLRLDGAEHGADLGVVLHPLGGGHLEDPRGPRGRAGGMRDHESQADQECQTIEPDREAVEARSGRVPGPGVGAALMAGVSVLPA